MVGYCVENSDWKYEAGTILGASVDVSGIEVASWSTNMYATVEEAQTACIALQNGCGGVTCVQKNKDCSVRLNDVVGDSTGGHSYIKPRLPCEG